MAHAAFYHTVGFGCVVESVFVWIICGGWWWSNAIQKCFCLFVCQAVRRAAHGQLPHNMHTSFRLKKPFKQYISYSVGKKSGSHGTVSFGSSLSQRTQLDEACPEEKSRGSDHQGSMARSGPGAEPGSLRPGRKVGRQEECRCSRRTRPAHFQL